MCEGPEYMFPVVTHVCLPQMSRVVCYILEALALTSDNGRSTKPIDRSVGIGGRTFTSIKVGAKDEGACVARASTWRRSACSDCGRIA